VAEWDIFHSDRLEAERALTTEQVRAGIARGEFHEDDLARPAGTKIAWTRIGDMPDFLAEAPAAAPPEAQAPAAPPTPPPPTEDVPTFEADEDESAFLLDVDEEVPQKGAGAGAFFSDDENPRPDLLAAAAQTGGTAGADLGEFDLELEPGSQVGVGADQEREEVASIASEVEEEFYYDPQEEDEEAAEFTLSRSAAERVEELDLAAMVDVAFQMVLFFLVTSVTLVFKTLELPKSKPDKPPDSVAQGTAPKNLDDLIKNDYILVEINPRGEIKIDHEAASPETLIDRLRAARKDTGRKGMLLSADFATPHRNAVLAYDAANELGLSIAIAKPAAGGEQPLPPAGGG
jgi:biopolymer transport protein ExbD